MAQIFPAAPVRANRRGIRTVLAAMASMLLAIGGAVLIATPASAALNTPTSITVGNGPTGMATTPDGSKTYVANFLSGTVSVIENATNTVTHTLNVGSEPVAIAVNPAGTRAYVSLRASGTVEVIDTASNAIVPSEEFTLAGGTSHGIVISADGTKAYVAAGTSIAVRNLVNNTTSSIALSGMALWLALTPDGSTLYASVRNNPSYSALVGISTATNTVVSGKTTQFLGTSEPTGVAASPDGNYVYVALRGSGDLARISTADNTITALAYNLGQPEQITVSADSSRIYTTASAGSGAPGKIKVIRASDGSLLEEGTTGNDPYGLQVSPNGGRVMVSNIAGSTVTVFEENVTPVIISACPPPATQGVAYSAQIKATGLPLPAFSVTAGSLPAGLTLSAKGLVSGTPTGATSSFTVTATNGVGTDSLNCTLTVTAAPGAPTGLGATAGDAQVALSWTAPVSTGGSAITDYVVEYATDLAGPWTVFADGVSTGTTATVTGLTNGTPYFFRVAAVNSVGTGAASGTATATPRAPIVPPAAPIGATVNGGLLQAHVSWTRSVGDLGVGLVSYTATIVQGLNTFSCTTTGTFCMLTGLAPGAVTANVVATSASGSSAPATATGTVLAAANAPSVAPADQGGVSVEFHNQAGQVVTEVSPGQPLTVVATGFAPHSLVDVFAYSTPRHLGSGLTDTAGRASFPVMVPTDLAAGKHTLVATGLSSGGATATASVVVRVAVVTNAPVLASTGSSNAAPMLLLGGLMLAAGVVLVLRRRRTFAK